MIEDLGSPNEGVITDADPIATISLPKGPIKLTMFGAFDGATVALEERINDIWTPVLDETTPISYTADNSFAYNLFTGDFIRMNATGGGGSVVINYKITYEV